MLTFHYPGGGGGGAEETERTLKKKNASVVFLYLARAKARANFSHVEMFDEIPVPSNETFILPPAHYDSNKLVISS